MRRYLQLWLSFLKISWMADLEYRVNIVMRIVGEFFWYLLQLSVFEVLYTHTDTIAGWDVHSMRVFMGTLFLVDVLYMIFVHENMEAIWSLVRKGDLDLYLVKPVNSQFMISCRKVSVSYVTNLVLVGGYLGWAISNLHQPVGAAQFVAFPLLVFCGVIILYSLRFLFATLTVVLNEAGNIQFIWYQLYRLATRPDPIYPYYLRYAILTVFPVAFLASVPARVLIEGVDWRLLAASPMIAIFSLWLSNYCWEGALKRYASASS
jgi:ABC-2 type transport system permease protein